MSTHNIRFCDKIRKNSKIFVVVFFFFFVFFFLFFELLVEFRRHSKTSEGS